MKLPDFLEFEPFNDMRKSLGTDQLGHFEFFDPNTQLTGEERSELARIGTETRSRQIRLFSDHTLGFKNSRIAIVENDVAHLTRCEKLSQSDKYQIVGRGKLLSSLNPCTQCLHDMRYQGFDMFRERKKSHSEYVLANFSFDQYFSLKQDYPVDCVSLTIRYLSQG